MVDVGLGGRGVLVGRGVDVGRGVGVDVGYGVYVGYGVAVGLLVGCGVLVGLGVAVGAVHGPWYTLPSHAVISVVHFFFGPGQQYCFVPQSPTLPA